MKSKFFFLLSVLLGVLAARFALLQWLEPEWNLQGALAAASGDGTDFAQARLWRGILSNVEFLLGIIAIACSILLARTGVDWLTKRGLVALMPIVMLTSCKPFDRPEYVQVGNNETAFVIPLEDTKERQNQQVKFDSEAFLNEAKVMAKRIVVAHRWEPQGRLWFTGEWLPTVVVMKVDRSPVTREWNSAHTQRKGEDKAIWIESADSVGFSMGVTCTAYITEQDSAKFLYMYPTGSLSSVMDSEIRARIQKVSAEVAAKYPLDQLRERKAEMMQALDTDVPPFFAERGITITTIGMFGGMTYENPKIQAAIDEVFVAQQQKNVALAEFEAQSKVNERSILAAKADAEQVTMKATAEAERRTLESTAEAKAIETVNRALADVSPMLIQLRSVEAQLKQVERWDGKHPTTFIGGLTQPNLLLNLPKLD